MNTTLRDMHDANLANAGLPRSSRSNLRNPDPFDGSDPLKLRTFLAQCSLHFMERTQDFRTDDDKIIYMLSFLKGMALEWFEVQMFDPDATTVPAWDGDFPRFVQELVQNFGPHDPVGDAEDEIKALRMKHSDRIALYITPFNRLATQTQWGMQALRHQFYEGLPSRIKDAMVNMDYPNTLLGVRLAAQKVDQRYWKRESEKKRAREREAASGGGGHGHSATTPSASSNQKGGGKKSSHQHNNKSGSSSGSGSGSSSSSGKPQGNSATSASSGSSASTSGTPKPYADKLDSSGHIKEAERERRRKNNLCMYCGGAGHKASDCKKRNKGNASGKAATTETPSNSGSTEPKK